ncbi:MAG: potassium-transporting ATPase subunit C [Desulfovibrio fairfieldensis]
MTTELTGNWGAQFAACLRLMLVSAVILCVLYPLAILAVGRTFTPWTAAGSLLLNERGQVVCSAQIAQAFTRPEYFWPRPSAGLCRQCHGRQQSLRRRLPAGTRVGKPESLEATPQRKVPADLVTASGSGMDPHITLKAAHWQAERVARARGLKPSDVVELADSLAETPGGVLNSAPLVNVLKLNMALDHLSGTIDAGSMSAPLEQGR